MKTSDIETAIAWLECNEGAGGESEKCLRVAKFLEAELERRNISAEARARGITTKRMREILRPYAERTQ